MEILIFIIILITILVIYYIYENIKNEYTKLATNLTFWKNKYNNHHKQIIEFIKNILPYFTKYNIIYWVHAGTLLGMVRHKGIIPWDDDIDFGYIDSENVNLLINEIKDKYIIENTFFGFKITDKTNNKIFIDMFKFNIDNDNNKVNQTKLSNIIWPKENYYFDELFPLVKEKFESIELPMPIGANKFCKKVYGNDYMDIFYVHSPHPDSFLSNIYDGIGIATIIGKKFYIKDLY